MQHQYVSLSPGSSLFLRILSLAWRITACSDRSSHSGFKVSPNGLLLDLSRLFLNRNWLILNRGLLEFFLFGCCKSWGWIVFALAKQFIFKNSCYLNNSSQLRPYKNYTELSFSVKNERSTVAYMISQERNRCHILWRICSALWSHLGLESLLT